MSLFEELDDYRSIDVPVAYNVQTLIDHSNGTWVVGTRGENILVGGFSHHTGVLAPANAGKTALALFMWACTLRRYPSSTGIIYEDEGTLQKNRINRQTNALTDGVPFTVDDNSRDRIVMIDGTRLYLDPFYDLLEKDANSRNKKRGVKKHSVTCPWRLSMEYGCMMLKPLIGLLDSASEAQVTSAAESAGDEKKTGKSVDAKERNTEFIREGLVKTKIYGGRFIRLGTVGDMCFVSTASLDNAGPALAGGPPGAQPEKPMGHLPSTKKMKQLGTSYKKRTSNLFQFGLPKTGFKGTGSAERYIRYPLTKDDLYLDNRDLEYVAVQNLRGKNGSSGASIDLWRSQSLGILSEITNVEFLIRWGVKEINYYGISDMGGYQYALDLLPDVKFRWTTLRAIYGADRRVTRALELLAGMKYEFYMINDATWNKYRCTPKELYEDIKALGYDWEELLGKTRSYWQFLEDEDPNLPPLSILDLLKMRVGEYKPYWMK